MGAIGAAQYHIPRRTIMEFLIVGIFHIYTFFAQVLMFIMAHVMMPSVKNLVERRMKQVGIGINSGGSGDLKISNDLAYLKILMEGDLGAIDSIMRGYVEYDGVKTFEKIFGSRKFHSVAHPLYRLLSKSQLHLPMKGWSSGEQPG